MQFDTSTTPFSRFGSYLTYEHEQVEGETATRGFLRTVHGGVQNKRVFQLELLVNEQPVAFHAEATPTLLSLKCENGVVEVCLPEPGLLRIRGRGVQLRLTYSAVHRTVFQVAAQRWLVNATQHSSQYMLTTLHGECHGKATWDISQWRIHFVAVYTPDPETGEFACAIEEFLSAWVPRRYSESFESCVQMVEDNYATWLTTIPSTPPELADAVALAAYTNWSSVVAPAGHLKRTAMLMSKNTMNSIWSWDNCFNAMALIYHSPQLAWDQLMLFLDLQDAKGAFPDSVNDSHLEWGFCKPPIHGWTLRWIMGRTDFVTLERVHEMYEPLARWTNWWFTYRDDDQDGVPQYNHGNDSGWDNATPFDIGHPLESPDLAAYLIIQLDVLAELAQRIGRLDEQQRWLVQADTLQEKMLQHFWHGDRFVARRSGDHTISDTGSLLFFLPLILGQRLPSEVRECLLTRLKEGDWLTEHGFATESIHSQDYRANGYWRGPIWASSTLLLVDALRSVGEVEFSQEISRRFCAMIARSGLAENYDAITGQGLCDQAYTWTASIFLILAHEYL